MWSLVGLSFLVSLVVIFITPWITKWRYPKCNGALPPGSMGLPFIGETLSLIIPSYSHDLLPFIKKRVRRYGPIFRTSLACRSVVISTDPEFNSYIFEQDGRLVEVWYLDTFSKVFDFEGDSRRNAAGIIHKYISRIFTKHFGAETLKEKLIAQIEEYVNQILRSWSSQASVEVKHASSAMYLEFTAKHMVGYDVEKSPVNLAEKYRRFIDGLMCIPLNIPGTAHYNCRQGQKAVTTMLRDMLRERRHATSETRREDFIGQISNDMDKEKFLSEDFVVQLMFAGIFNAESISPVLALAITLLTEHPSALQELTAEHEAILKNRKDPNSSVTWDEYKSMNFTLQVVSETIRLINSAPGLFRRTVKDITVNGFTIPAGWSLILASSALHLNPNIFKEPAEFNPWRWKDLDSDTISKNFKAFGGGMRQCSGAEYSKAFLAICLHVLVTKYKWAMTKKAKIVRNPTLGFGDGIHIKLEEKKN
ncbi:cucurbitadienol 11-hydroxylase-like [Malus sylvestris]|uniref:cucurbitadienol 11-hydroxylase-like n=1 Tax=Malus sylvestris TaxID=3752 RepID=UPI0021AD22A6|nr:cucurbitadienol 11-hydroxylase-like [Malus sylvestris]